MKRLFAALVAAFLLAGCGSSNEDSLTPNPLQGRDLSRALSGVVRLTPVTPVSGVPVSLLSPSGNLLDTGVTGVDGTFIFEHPPFPASYELQATLQDGTVLRSREENSSDDFVVIDLLTNLIANWDARNPDQTLDESIREVLDSLSISQAHGGEAAYNDSIHSPFDPDIFLQQATEGNGIQALTDAHLDQYTADLERSVVFTSAVPQAPVDREFLAAMEQNLPGPGITDARGASVLGQGIGPASLVGPIAGFAFNWVAGKLGLIGMLNLAQEISGAVKDLQASIRSLDIQLKIILDLLLDNFYNVAAAGLNAPEAAIATEENTLTNLFAGSDFVALESDFAKLDTIINGLVTNLSLLHTNLNGNSAQTGGILKSYLDKTKTGGVLMRQDIFDGMAFLIRRERGYQIGGLNVQLERLHQSFRPNFMNEGALAFDREMLRMKTTENQLVKQLEFMATNGSDKTFTGLSQAERHWAQRAIPLQVLESLQDFGIGEPVFETRSTSAIQDGFAGYAFEADSVAGFNVGNNVFFGTGADQITQKIVGISGKRVTLDATGLKKTFPIGTLVRRGRGSSLPLTNVLYDKDAGLVWLLDAANYWSNDLGYKETNVHGWLTPTPGQLTHLLSHVQERGEARSMAGLATLGFRGLNMQSNHLAAASSRQSFNFIDAFFRVSDGASGTHANQDDPQRRIFRDIDWFIPEWGIKVFLTQQILVLEPTFGLSALEVFVQDGSTRVAQAEAYPGSSLRLELDAICRDKDNITRTVRLTNRATWTVIAGPRIHDPMGDGQQGAFDGSRVRISNAPGNEGRLEVRDLMGDKTRTGVEEYTIQAQLGSNVATFPVRINLEPAKTKPDALYVSHVISQRHHVLTAGTTALFKAFGRFAPQPGTGLSANLTKAGPGIDFGQDITADSRLVWSVLNDSVAGGPDVTQIATIAPQANINTGQAQLNINRNDPSNVIPDGGLLVTVQATWAGSKKAADARVVAQAKVQVFR